MSWVTGQGSDYIVHIQEWHSFPNSEFRNELWSLGVFCLVSTLFLICRHTHWTVLSAWLKFILGSPRLSLVMVVVKVGQTQAFSPGSTALLRAVHLPCPQTPHCLDHELCSGLNSRHCGHVLSHTPSLLGKWVPSTVPPCAPVHPLNGHMGQVLATLQTTELHQHSLFCSLIHLEKQFRNVVSTGRTEDNWRERD